MNHDKVNMLSTATIAFVTVLATMGGFYFNLKKEETPVIVIIVFELAFVVAVLLFIRWIHKRGEQGWHKAKESAHGLNN